MKKFGICCSLSVLILGLMASAALAGKPGTEPPPPPPVTYELRVFDMPTSYAGYIGVEAQAMSEEGLVVGSFQTMDSVWHPFLYSIVTDIAVDLNDLGVVGIPTGWQIGSANGVNNLGYVVGTMLDLDDSNQRCGYLLDLNTSPPKLSTIPAGSGLSSAQQINDNMDIVGQRQLPDGTWRSYLYNPLSDNSISELGFEIRGGLHINNPLPGFDTHLAYMRASDRQVVRWNIDTGEVTDLFVMASGSNAAPRAVSPKGVVCGNYALKGRNNYVAFRYGASLETLPNMRYSTAINAHGDISSHDERTLYHAGTGIIDLSNTLIGADDELFSWFDASVVVIADITERGALNPQVPAFPALCGSLSKFSGNGGRGFVLIPISTP